MPDNKSDQVADLRRRHKPLYKSIGENGDDSDEGVLTHLMKAQQVAEEGKSNQKRSWGLIPHPFNRSGVNEFLTANEHHSTSIHTKTAALVGLGHVTEQKKAMRRGEEVSAENMEITSRVDTTLNPLTRKTWAETLYDVAEDFVNQGDGYLEVVRRNGVITGIHHLPATHTNVYLEQDGHNFHYVVCTKGEGGSFSTGGIQKRFACFGEKEGFIQRMSSSQIPGIESQSLDPDTVSEVIHFRRPNSMSRWYGYPDWLSAAASIELVQIIVQHNFDFFLNRCVPEVLMLFLGQKLDPEDWKKIKAAFEGTIGPGKNYKSILANLEVNEDFRVQLEKLAEDNGDEDRFSSMRENLALSIVSAHRVPPLLAGIQIPGKLGATNELPNALMSFQILVIGPMQKLFQQTLGSTLGEDLGLTIEDFEFVTITEEINVGEMDTVARMRQSPMQAEQEGRDLDQGVRS